MSRSPVTKQEWQEAVDAAEVLLLVDAARKYGLITGGPEVNGTRCEEILTRGRALGIRPRADAVARLLTPGGADTTVQCETCGATRRVVAARCLSLGWPQCHGRTMRVTETTADLGAAATQAVGPGLKAVRAALKSPGGQSHGGR